MNDVGSRSGLSAMQFTIVGFSYDLPFPLMLPSPSSYLVKLNAPELCFIRIEVLMGRTEFTTASAIEQRVVWDEHKGLRAEATAFDSLGNEMRGLDVLLDENSRPLIYRRDKGYSHVEVGLRVPDGEDSAAYQKRGKDLASNILAQFLLGYRWYANDHTIPEFRVDQIPVIGASIGTCEVKKAKTVGETAEVKVQYSNNRPTFQMEEMGRHVKQSLAADIIRAFETWLQGGMVMPESSRLLLIATERGILQQEYSSTVIFAQTAFEVFVSDFIKRRALASNIASLPLPKRGSKIQFKPVIEALQEVFLKHILRKYVPLVTKAHINGTQEYAEWDNHAYGLRNQIVHAGRTEVSRPEAERAFSSVTALMNKLESLT